MMIAAPYYLFAIFTAFTAVICYAAVSEHWYWKGFQYGKRFEQNNKSQRITNRG